MDVEVNIDWPFITEALDNAEEAEADRIQEALERIMALGAAVSSADIFRLGSEVLNQVEKYMIEVREIKNGTES